MYLTTAEIAEILENVEDLSPKRLSDVIIDMAERIANLERCNFDLSTEYNILKDECNELKKSYAKLHLNQIYGKFITESSKEPIKNHLGVDCVSREQVLVAIRNLYPSMPRVDFNGSLRKWSDKYKPYIECEDAIKELPSVTS